MKKVSRYLHVIENRSLSQDVFVLTLGSEEPLPEIIPGQFVNVLVEPANGAFLRRPFSVHDVDFTHRFIKLYIQKKGKGTQQLAKLTTADSVDVLFPLGNGFTIKNEEPLTLNPSPLTLLVGGGAGIAPLLYLSKILNQNNIQPTILIGGRSKQNILCVEDYVKYGKVLVMTDDGSMGEKGLVTQNPIFYQQKISQIYCCGPDPMMEAVAKIATEQNIPCQISLENMMACGIGACLCCVTKTKDGHKCVCTEGPVFDIKDLEM